ncbi:hypothetical protein PQX77_001130 [Marasmius sp. AFHP31]|nr:hypothetical protein PQX77_001130 [Marasmius sp. AFHP31]
MVEAHIFRRWTDNSKVLYRNLKKKQNITQCSQGLIAAPVQLFMAWRIKIISGSRLLALAISILSLCSLAGGIWVGVAVSQKPNWQDFELFKAAPGTWLVTAAAADVLIAASLVYFLMKRKTPFVSTNDQIDRIVRCKWSTIVMSINALN